MQETIYFHAVEGRMRIKIPSVKKSVQRAAELEREMREVTGVTEVTASTTTGNALILFDSRRTNHAELLYTLRLKGYLNADHQPATAEAANCHECGAKVHRHAPVKKGNLGVEVENSVANFLAQSVVEFGMKGLLAALL